MVTEVLCADLDLNMQLGGGEGVMVPLTTYVVNRASNIIYKLIIKLRIMQPANSQRRNLLNETNINSD